jgi:hypothetical protein
LCRFAALSDFLILVLAWLAALKAFSVPHPDEQG